ncbi:MAG: hypothetical protein FWE16_01220 [Firmicutes bacterium]|nr:hypothetical protein [Bacillota bacterium]
MEFIKNNWMKIFMATMTLAGAVLFVVLLTMYDASYHNELASPLLPEAIADPSNATSFLFGHIAGLTFFALITIVIVVSMFEKTKLYKKFVLCAVGIICTALMTVSIINAIGSEQSKFAREVMNGEHDAAITTAVEIQAAPMVREGVRAVVRANFLAENGPIYNINPALIDLLSEEAIGDWVATLVDQGIPEAQAQGLMVAFNGAVDTAFPDALADAVAENAPAQISEAQDAARYQFFSRVVTLVTQLMIFGLLPLAWGIRKITNRNEN